jgi:hypothetical protein
MQNKTLVEILKHHKWDCDKDPHCGNKMFLGHTYLEVYDRLFSVYQHEDINVLEIGILRGTSMKLWHEYFSKATIWGADTFERTSWVGCTLNEVTETLKDYTRTKLVQVNSCSNDFNAMIERNKFLESIPDGFFHVIIDDGSHELNDQVQTYNNFKSKLNKDGIYIVEDIGITNSMAIEPNLLINEIPELHLIDMRFPEKYDNALAIYYDSESIHFKHHDEYMLSKHWETSPEFTYEYILNKQREQ